MVKRSLYCLHIGGGASTADSHCRSSCESGMPKICFGVALFERLDCAIVEYLQKTSQIFQIIDQLQGVEGFEIPCPIRDLLHMPIRMRGKFAASVRRPKAERLSASRGFASPPGP